jgi:hypothetical protein
MKSKKLYPIIFNTFILILLILFIIFIIFIKKKEGFENEIPKKVFQTWKTKNLPPLMDKNRNRMLELNTEFEYILMDDEECRDFIDTYFNDDVLNAYDRLIPGAYKADLWRYCVLYIHGGIYLDIKLRPSDDFRLIELTNDEHFVLDREEYFKPDTIGIYNACLVQKKGSQCMKICIDKIVENVRNNYYGYNNLYPTGPGLLGSVYSVLYKDQSKIDLKYIGNENVIKDGIIVIHSYPEYRKEAPSTGKYFKLWYEKNIYK